MPQEAEAPSLKQRLTDEQKQAKLARDRARVSVISLLMAAVKNAEIARGGDVSDADILGIIAKDIRQHQESVAAFKQGNRDDLVAQEEAELVILQEYLPQQVSRDEIVAEARRVIAEVGAQGPRDKGKVMPRIIAELKGKADGREINDVVTELLGS